MFGGLYGFALWATRARPGDAADPAVSSRARRRYDPGKHERVGRRGAAVVSVGRILRDYREAGAVNALLALWGFVDDDDVPDEGRPCRRGLPPARHRLRRPDARAAAAAGPPLRGGAPAAGRALPRLPVRASSARVEPVRRGAVRAARRARGHPAPRGLPERPARRPVRRSTTTSCCSTSRRTSARRARRCARCWRAPRDGAAATGCRTARPCRLLEAELDRAIDTLHHKAQAFEVQLSDVRPARGCRKPRRSGSSGGW